MANEGGLYCTLATKEEGTALMPPRLLMVLVLTPEGKEHTATLAGGGATREPPDGAGDTDGGGMKVEYIMLLGPVCCGKIKSVNPIL